MYRIRLHGRGGQGMKTASRILGSAFFGAGLEVQDAPRYGAERRGAPIFAYVRASSTPIRERGIIRRPDLVVVADASLVPMAAAGVLIGASEHTVLLINSDDEPESWHRRLQFRGRVITLPAHPGKRHEIPYIGAVCAGAAARCVGVLSRDQLGGAIRTELHAMEPQVISKNLDQALAAFNSLADHEGCVQEGAAPEAALHEPPGWVVLPRDPAGAAAPDIHVPRTSVQVRTGLWRTMRPVIDRDHCHRCHWICSTLCPDGVIAVDETGRPEIDYDHCKGCLVCVAVCPPHAIRAIPEHSPTARSREVAA